jgi:hypothetical protein
MTLLAASIGALVIGLRSSLPVLAIAGPDSSSSAVIAAFTTAFVTEIGTGGGGEDLLQHAIVAIGAPWRHGHPDLLVEAPLRFHGPKRGQPCRYKSSAAPAISGAKCRFAFVDARSKSSKTSISGMDQTIVTSRCKAMTAICIFCVSTKAVWSGMTMFQSPQAVSAHAAARQPPARTALATLPWYFVAGPFRRKRCARSCAVRSI